MIREVDLVSYLPPYLKDFQEDKAALDALNPEYTLIWSATDRVLKNEFIETADEYGISRFEALLKIFPYEEDTLESRRARVAARWFNSLPYTIRLFLEKVITICGDSDFKLTHDFNTGYTLSLITALEKYGQVEELELIVNTWIPANINFISKNQLAFNADGIAIIGGGICFVSKFCITNDWRFNATINGVAGVGGGAVHGMLEFVTNDSKENYSVSGAALAFGGAVATERMRITGDGQDTYTAEGAALSTGGAVNTARVVIVNDFNETFKVNGGANMGAGMTFQEVVEISTNT